jgi:hypothetical protein
LTSRAFFAIASCKFDTLFRQVYFCSQGSVITGYSRDLAKACLKDLAVFLRD